MQNRKYEYREGVHGEHFIVRSELRWVPQDTISRAATKEDAEKILSELNALNAAIFAK